MSRETAFVVLVPFIVVLAAAGPDLRMLQTLEDPIAQADPLASSAKSDFFSVLNPPAGTVVVTRALLDDNGDHDGWADSNETVSMRLLVYNRMGMALSGVVARLSTTDPKIVCITAPLLYVGELGDRETALTSGEFRFLVADVERTAAEEPFSATFEVQMSADQFAALPEPQRVTLDLDLDAAGGSDPTVFFEGFEGGFGAFTTMQLDEDLNPPPEDLTDHPAGLQNADGYRCQYTDPDWENSNIRYPQTQYDCYPNPTGRPDAYWWDVIADRAFHGSGAMYFGQSPNAQWPDFTTPLAQLEAVATTNPIDLAWQPMCSAAHTACIDDAECPAGESCVEPSPSLSIKHQISLYDERLNGPRGTATDRAVVQVQLAAADGTPTGDWETLVPHLNVYDKVPLSSYLHCMFDPIDDGNSEEDFFDPADPERRLGPSSTCLPAQVFANLGDTEGPFVPEEIGSASDGPGLEGSTGAGTWVESRFDLQRYRGRRIRLRFLVSSIKLGARHPDDPSWKESGLTWDAAFLNDFGPWEDGWFIDDVTVSDTLVTPATLTPDTKDNSALAQDWDLDGQVCDCQPNDATVWSLPGATSGLTLWHDGGPAGMTTLHWLPPADPGGLTVWYDTLRSTRSDDFMGPVVCVETDDGSDTTAVDTGTPEAGAVYYYLVRTENACTGDGGVLGEGPNGLPRSAHSCP